MVAALRCAQNTSSTSRTREQLRRPSFHRVRQRTRRACFLAGCLYQLMPLSRFAAAKAAVVPRRCVVHSSLAELLCTGLASGLAYLLACRRRRQRCRFCCRCRCWCTSHSKQTELGGERAGQGHTIFQPFTTTRYHRSSFRRAKSARRPAGCRESGRAGSQAGSSWEDGSASRAAGGGGH